MWLLASTLIVSALDAACAHWKVTVPALVEFTTQPWMLTPKVRFAEPTDNAPDSVSSAIGLAVVGDAPKPVTLLDCDPIAPHSIVADAGTLHPHLKSVVEPVAVTAMAAKNAHTSLAAIAHG